MEIDKKFGWNVTVFYARVPTGGYVSTAKSSDDVKAEAFSKPASAECIFAHLTRLSTFLHVKGNAKNEDGIQSLFLVTDYAQRLHDEKVLEVDVFLACEHFIETEEAGFFPTYAKLLKAVGKEAR